MKNVARPIFGAWLLASLPLAAALAQVNSNENNALLFTVNDVEYMQINGTSGNVGVGTNAPAERLHVSGTLLATRGTAESGLEHLRLQTTDYGTSNPFFFIKPASSANWNVGLWNGSSVTGTINLQSQRVAINNLNAKAELDVTGNISATGMIDVGHTAQACTTGISGSIRYETASDTLQICTSAGWKSLTSASTVGYSSVASGTGAVQFNSGGQLAGDTNSLFWDGANKRLGIGNDAPGTALGVTGGLSIGGTSEAVSSTLSGQNSIQLATDTYFGGVYDNHTGYLIYSVMPGGWGTARLNFARSTEWAMYDTANPVLSVGSNIGIGTSTPSATLHVTGNGTPYAMFGASGTSAIELRANDNASGFFIRNDGYNPVISTKVGDLYFGYNGHSGMSMRFYTSNTIAGLWNAYGNLGVGTDNPGVRLDVSGTLRVRHPWANQITADTTAVSQQATIGFASNGTNKWQMGKDTNDAFFLWDGAAARPMLWVASNGNMALAVSGGNVGVGTANPNAKLEVNGTVSATDVRVNGNSVATIPTGAIMAFDLTSCPSGWSEYTAARGRFLRGIDNGAGIDPDGTRAPGSTQVDGLGSHLHSIDPPSTATDSAGAHAHTYNQPNITASYRNNLESGSNGNQTVTAGASTSTNGAHTHTVNIAAFDSASTGGVETRPKNVAVLFCRKN